MARINSRAKGANGERELAEWLESSFDLKEKPKRNLEQVRAGGADLIVRPFAFEVKRVETLNLYEWWGQIKRAVINPADICFGFEPVVAFRQNRRDWEFLISAKHIHGIDQGYLRITAPTFKKWVPEYLKRFTSFDQVKLGNGQVQSVPNHEFKIGVYNDK